MKRILLALLFCGASLEVLGAGTRNLIMTIDWGKEQFEKEFNRNQLSLRSEEFGAITLALMMAIVEKAAPIIVSSATWGNLIARGAMFRDAIQGNDMSYLQRYFVFSNPQNIAAFKAMLQNGYDPKTDLMYQGVQNNGQLYYYFAYELFFSKNPAFKPNEWIVKKISDYIYLLIPLSYVQELQLRQDTPMGDQIEYEAGKKENIQLSTSLSSRERLIGMKVDKFPDMPASALLDMFAHPTQMNVANYKSLAAPRAFSMVQQLLQYKWQDILKDFLFGQHLIYVLSQLFVTHADLKFPGGNKEKTDVNEAYFLHEWLVYLGGHGSVSNAGPLMPVVTTTGGGYSGQIAFTAGIEQGAFRDLLGLLNNQINTGSLIYFSCYSGGPHLFKLFEHHWDYPRTEKVSKQSKGGGYSEIVTIKAGEHIKKDGNIKPGEKVAVTEYTQAAKDVFNYLIIATNQFYTTTLSPTVGFWFEYNTNYWPRLPGKPAHKKQQKGAEQEKPNGLEFENYFRSMAQLLHPVPKVIGQKNGKKKQKIAQMPSLQQELIKTISYVHQFDFSKNYMIPAIRMPYTEWFVSLADLGAQLRFETAAAKKEREDAERQARTLLPAKLAAKKIPAKVLESIKLYEAASPDIQEKARLEKERLEKEEKDRKEKELFERMEKMRKEQEEREKAKQKPEPVKPPTTVSPVTPQPIKPQPVPPVTPQPIKPQPVSPVTPQPIKPQPVSPVIPQPVKPQPVPPVPQPTTLKPPVGGVPLQPIDINKLPPPVVIPPGTKPPTLPTQLPPPPQIPFPGQSQLSQSLKNLEGALKNLTTRLR